MLWQNPRNFKILAYKDIQRSSDSNRRVGVVNVRVLEASWCWMLDARFWINQKKKNSLLNPVSLRGVGPTSRRPVTSIQHRPDTGKNTWNKNLTQNLRSWPIKTPSGGAFKTQVQTTRKKSLRTSFMIKSEFFLAFKGTVVSLMKDVFDLSSPMAIS